MIAIFGYNDAAKELLSDLDHTDVVILESDPKTLNKAQNDGFNTAHISLESDDDLKHAGIGGSIASLFALHHNSSLNLFLTISARILDPKLMIIALATKTEDHQQIIQAGANKTINVHELGGIRAYRMLRQPTLQDMLDRFVQKKGLFTLAQITIDKNSALQNKTFYEIDSAYRIIIVGVIDRELGNEFIFHNPAVDHKIVCGEVLVVLGTQKDIDHFIHEHKR
jgi:voltage-gated potassium channel